MRLILNVRSLVLICDLSNRLHALIRAGTKVFRHGLAAVLGPKRQAEGTDIAFDLTVAARFLGKSWLESSYAHFRVTVSVQRPLINVGRTYNHVLIVENSQLGVHVNHVSQRFATFFCYTSRLWCRKIGRNFIRAFLLGRGKEHEIVRRMLIIQPLSVKRAGNTIHHHLHGAGLPP